MLRSLIVIFGVSSIVVYVPQKLKLLSVVGFLLSGVLIGPYSAGILRDIRSVEVLAAVPNL